MDLIAAICIFRSAFLLKRLLSSRGGRLSTTPGIDRSLVCERIRPDLFIFLHVLYLSRRRLRQPKRQQQRRLPAPRYCERLQSSQVSICSIYYMACHGIPQYLPCQCSRELLCAGGAAQHGEREREREIAHMHTQQKNTESPKGQREAELRETVQRPIVNERSSRFIDTRS